MSLGPPEDGGHLDTQNGTDHTTFMGSPTTPLLYYNLPQESFLSNLGG